MLAEFALAEVRRLVDRKHVEIAPALPPARPMPPRLAEVLELLLDGQSPKAIARRLGLSLWTVREHVQRLYRYEGVNGRDELTARYVRGGPRKA